MNILEFLTSMYSRVVEFFQNLWYSVIFITLTAFHSIYTYYSRLQYYLTTFANAYVYSTDWYHNFAKNPLNALGVFNFHKSFYTAVQSHPQQVEYNENLRTPLQTFVYTLQHKVSNFFTVAYDSVMFVISYPQHVIDYAFRIGAEITRRYELFERPTVQFLQQKQPKVETLTEDGFFNHLVHVGSTIFNPISETFGPQYSKLKSLLNSASKVAGLMNDYVYPKIVATFTSDYSGLAGLLDVAKNVIDVMSPTKKTKLDYLLDKGFDHLVSISEEPQETFLGAIRDTFLAWFGNLLYEWLMTPIGDE